MSTHVDEVGTDVEIREPYRIDGKRFYGRWDSTVSVLLLSARPDAGAVWEREDGLWHVAYVTSTTHPLVTTYVAHMKPGRGPGVVRTS